jgi:hypothetical protein
MIAIAGLEGALIGTCVVDGVEVFSYDSVRALNIFKEQLNSYSDAVSLLQDFVQERRRGGPLFVYISQDVPTGAESGATIH